MNIWHLTRLPIKRRKRRRSRKRTESAQEAHQNKPSVRQHAAGKTTANRRGQIMIRGLRLPKLTGEPLGGAQINVNVDMGCTRMRNIAVILIFLAMVVGVIGANARSAHTLHSPRAVTLWSVIVNNHDARNANPGAEKPCCR
jgi:hypothetical protein